MKNKIPESGSNGHSKTWFAMLVETVGKERLRRVHDKAMTNPASTTRTKEKRPLHNRTRFHERDPCPICGTGSKGCSVQEDGLHFCGGERADKGKRIGRFKSLGPCTTDEHWCLFRRTGGKAPPKKPVGTRGGADPTPTANGKPNWDERHVQARRAMSPALLLELAEDLGIPPSALERVGAGFVAEGTRERFTFPMYSVDGTLCGLAARDRSTEKKINLKGSNGGVLVPSGWEQGEGPVLIPEGASDLAALTAMGLPALARPSAKAGTDALIGLLSGCDREVIVLGEWDPKPDGSWPGKEGAKATAEKLANALGRPVEWALPPAGEAKDVREWFALQGLNHESTSEDCCEAGVRFVGELRRMKVDPSAEAGEEGEDGSDDIRTIEDIPTLVDAENAGAKLEYVWPKWIVAGGVNGLLGNFGDGKTRFIAELIRRIRSGECWPDGQEMNLPTDSRFLLVPADYQHSELTDLANNYGFPKDAAFLNAGKKDPLEVQMLDSVEAIEALEKRIQILKPALVIVDPIMGAQTEHSFTRAEDVTRMISPLQRLARIYNVPFLLCIHTNASGGSYGRHATGKFRVEMKLTKVQTDAGEERYRLEVGTSRGKKPDPIGATQADGGWDFDDDPPELPRFDGEGGPGRRAKGDEEAKAFLRDKLADADGKERLKCELIGEWEQGGHSNKTLYASAKEMLADGELAEGEQPAPKGRRILKTWKLPPTQED